MKLIKTWEEYCQKHGADPNNLPDVSLYPAQHQAAAIAQYKLWLMAEDVNAGWKPDWSNWNERKWYPYFNMEKADAKSGSGFSCTGYGLWRASTFVGSRLCFKDEETAEHAGTEWLSLFLDLMVLPLI